MKKIFLVIMSLFLAWPVWAQTQNFLITATVPAATSVGITVSRVNGTTNQFAPVTSNSLSFDPLVYNATNGIFLPNHYYALDIAPVGGAGGTMQTTFNFVPGATPNTNGHGLGYKSNITFVKVTGSGTNTTDQALTSHGPKKLLKDVNGETIMGNETTGGWLRTYLGVNSLDPAATYPDPVGAEPFTTTDAAGAYQGTLTITSVLP